VCSAGFIYISYLSSNSRPCRIQWGVTVQKVIIDFAWESTAERSIKGSVLAS
jgi:hypothetical protein